MLSRRFLIVLSLFVSFIAVALRPAHAQELPQPQGLVNDFAGILSSDTRQQLEDQLTQLEKDSTIEMAVVTVGSLAGTTIEDYAVKLFEDWQIGKKDQDNGVLLLIAPNERELRIEVGYGLEPVLTDSKAGRIIRNIITPEFKQGGYDTGVEKGVEAIIKVIHGEVSSSSDDGSFWIFFAIGAIFLSYLSSFLARSKRFWPGGIIGAILGLILGIYLATLTAIVLAAIGLGILGLLFDYALSKNYKVRKSKGLPTSWWGSGGGFFSGGGFGGGSSGGGGASGRW